MDKQASAILDYWFGELEDGFPVASRHHFWFTVDQQTDDYIREHFSSLLTAAGAGELHDWARSARGRLALIILLDQFSRNIYRGRSAAFQFDAQALALAKEGLTLGHDQQLSWAECVFYYMPFEHAENMAEQQHCVELFTALRDRAPSRHYERLQEMLGYVLAHHDIIKQFGRFPHRNEVLGRPSTADELAYLKNADRFGQ